MEYKSRFESSVVIQTKNGLLIDICAITFCYKIIQITEDKLRVRRRVDGRKNKETGKIKPFSSYMDARNHATNLVKFVSL